MRTTLPPISSFHHKWLSRVSSMGLFCCLCWMVSWAQFYFVPDRFHINHRHVQTSSSAWGPSEQPEAVFLCRGPVTARASGWAFSWRAWGASACMAAWATGANSGLQWELQGCCGSILWPCGFCCSYGYMLVWMRKGGGGELVVVFSWWIRV